MVWGGKKIKKETMGGTEVGSVQVKTCPRFSSKQLTALCAMIFGGGDQSFPAQTLSLLMALPGMAAPVLHGKVLSTWNVQPVSWHFCNRTELWEWDFLICVVTNEECVTWLYRAGTGICLWNNEDSVPTIYTVHIGQEASDPNLYFKKEYQKE